MMDGWMDGWRETSAVPGTKCTFDKVVVITIGVFIAIYSFLGMLALRREVPNKNSWFLTRQETCHFFVMLKLVSR